MHIYATTNITPLQFMHRYHNMVAIVADESETGIVNHEAIAGLKLNKYLIARWNGKKYKDSTDSDEQKKYKKYEHFKKNQITWLRKLKKWNRHKQFAEKEATKGLTRAFNGKGRPEDYELVLEAAAYSGFVEAKLKPLQTFCDAHLGIDCSGFVNAYFNAKGKVGNEDSKLISSFFRQRTALRTTTSEITQGDLLIWMTNSGAVKTAPGHIALVQGKSVSPGGDKDTIHVVESTGKLGICESHYQVKKIMKKGGHSAFRVFRPKKSSTSWVKVVKPF